MANDELAKVKAKIRALSEKTVENGCTEAEADMAMEKVGQLLSTYNLSMTEVDLRDEPFIEKFFECWSRGKTPVYASLTAIARFCDVRVWVVPPSHYDKNAKFKYFFFGFETDVSMAMYLTETIEKAIATSLNEFKKTAPYLVSNNKKGATNSFYLGMGYRVYHRLEEMKNLAERELQEKQMATTPLLEKKESTALTLLKEKLVEDAFKQKGMKLRNRHTSAHVSNGSAYAHGGAAGDKVNLNRPIGSNGGAQLQIGNK